MHLGTLQDVFLLQETQSHWKLWSPCDRGHCSLPLLLLVLRDPPTVDSGLLVPANGVIIQAVTEVMAVKGEKSFVREQRQGKVFIRMTLATCSVFSQGLG